MAFSPFVLEALKGFLKIFIYINQLSHGIGRSRIKGIKGIKGVRQSHNTSNPFNPLILVDGLGYGNPMNEEDNDQRPRRSDEGDGEASCSSSMVARVTVASCVLSEPHRKAATWKRQSDSGALPPSVKKSGSFLRPE